MDHHMEKYFNSQENSDVTIRFCGREFKAHKLILAHGSLYFQNGFNGDFVESNTNVIELQDDNVDAVQNMLEWLYGIDYNLDTAPEGADSAVHTKIWTKYLVLLVDLLVVATKYVVPTLRSDVLKAFPTEMEGNSLRLLGAVEKTVRHVYRECKDEAKELRKPIINMFAKYIGVLGGLPKYRQLFLDIPELAADVIHAVAEKQAKIQKK